MKNLLASLLLLSSMTAYGQSDFLLIDKDFSRSNLEPIHQGKNEIILTFDDGPNPGVTDKFLDLLGEYGVKATFFVIGANAKRNPALMDRIINEGHIVGNHSMTHTPLKNLGPFVWKTKVKSEVMEAHELLVPYMTNNRRFYFRAPEGAWAQKYADFLNEDPIGREYAGPLLWDIGGEIEFKNGKYLQAADWACWSKKISIDDCLSGYINESVRKKGGVILMHDLRKQSLEMLKKLIPELQDRGFSFATLNDVDFK